MPAVVVPAPPPVYEQHENPRFDMIGQSRSQTPAAAAEQEASLQRSVAEASRANKRALADVQQQTREVVTFEERARSTLSDLMRDMEPDHDRDE